MWPPKLFRKWFRMSSPDKVDSLEGERLGPDLVLTIRSGWDQMSVKVSAEDADRLTDWLRRTARPNNVERTDNVIKFPRLSPALPVPGTPPSSGPGPGRDEPEVE